MFNVEKKELPPLYIRGENPGEFRTYLIEAYDHFGMGGASIKIQYGRLGGKLVKKITEDIQGKNIGKSNVSTPFKQALSEAEAKWVKKIKSGYSSLESIYVEEQNKNCYIHNNHEYETLELVLEVALPKAKTGGQIGLPKPMLAKKHFTKTGKFLNIKFPRIGQAKYNGQRCLATHDILMSRTEEVHDKHLNFILSDVKKLPKSIKYDGNDYPLILDGELYIRGLPVNEINSAVKKANLNTHNLRLYVFDLVIPEIPQLERLKILKNLLKDVPEIQFLIRAPYFPVYSWEEAIKVMDNFIAKGYEGLILRSTNGEYQFGKRPNDLIKVKKKEKAYFQILDVSDTIKNPGMPIFTLRNDLNSNVFQCNSSGTKEEREAMFNKRINLIGKYALIEFYERTATKDIPFHTTFVELVDTLPKNK